MLQVAICDDSIKELENTYILVEHYRDLHPELDISLRKFASSYDLLDAVQTRGGYDIYLLDILMPQINGIELGTAIRKTDSAAVLIYLTSSPDYALESYRVEAQQYLLKPFGQDELFASLDKAAEWLDAEESKRLIIRTQDGTLAVPFCRILYAEYYKHRLIVHRTDGKRLESNSSRDSFEQLAAPLAADSRFVRISSSHIVNMQHIQSASSRLFEMADNEKLPLSRLYSGARQIYMNYLLERGGGYNVTDCGFSSQNKDRIL